MYEEIIYILYIGVGGFLGAICRYITVLYLKKRIPGNFPNGTLIVNLTGSFLLGVLLGINGKESVTLFFGTGFMGAFTTFSTFKLETIQLLESKEKSSAFVYAFLTYFLGITLAYLGFVLGRI